MSFDLRFHSSPQYPEAAAPAAAPSGPRSVHLVGPARRGTGVAARPTLQDGLAASPAPAPAQLPPNGSAALALPSRPAARSADFASLYCRARGLRPDQFVSSVFWRSLSARGLILGLPIHLLRRGFSPGNRIFLARVGCSVSMDQYYGIEERFWRRCARHSYLRELFELRVSTRRLRRLVARTFAWSH